MSPAGNDAGVGSAVRPFATLERAQRAVRSLKARGLKAPVEVVITGGTYFLTKPLTLAPADSGAPDAPITWRGAPGAVVTLSGGLPLTGWRRQGGQVWAARVPAAAKTGFRLLRVGDRWAVRARYPKFDPQRPDTGGWLFARWSGEPWERGAFGAAVGGLQDVGARLSWNVQVPAAGSYRVWVRYAQHNRDDGSMDMSGRTAFQADDTAPVPLTALPDTGGWDSYRWSSSAALTLMPGRHTLHWINRQGGGINLDAFALSDDGGWKPTLNGDLPAPAVGKHLLLVQAEACDTAAGPHVQVPHPTPPGSSHEIGFTAGQLPHWDDTAGAELHVFPDLEYYNAILPVTGIDYPRHKILFDGSDQAVRAGNRYFIDNVRGALRAPGEWYLDQARGEALYIADGPRFPRVPTVAAHLDRLVALHGDAKSGRYVENIRFEGIRFRDTSYTITHDYYEPADAAIWMSGARNCVIKGCDFRWLGGYALRLEDDSQHIEFSGNRLQDMGEGGVILLGDNATHPHHNLIAGNTMRRLGLIYKHVAGVYVTTGSDNRIAYNTISDLSRYGVSLKSYDGSHSSHGNIVEFNDIRRVNRETHDSGAIETLGRDREPSGNVIRDNLILDTGGLGTTADGTIHTPDFTWGIYLDDFSSGTTVSGNIVARSVLGGFDIHGGRDNVIENNVFVDGAEQQLFYQPIESGFMIGNRFRRNIVVYDRPAAGLVRAFDPRRTYFSAWDDNLYWLRGADLTRLPVRNTPEGDWAQWRAAGYDAHSRVADPLFVDAARDDYRLRPDSPAWALGFRRIPVEEIGARGWHGH